MNGEWFKVYTESAFVGWTSRLTNEQFGVWVKILAVIKHCGRAGIAPRARFDEWLSKVNVTTTQLAEIIEMANGGIVVGDEVEICNWRKYQVDRTNAERQARYRSNGSNALRPLRNAVTTEKRTEENRGDESNALLTRSEQPEFGGFEKPRLTTTDGRRLSGVAYRAWGKLSDILPKLPASSPARLKDPSDADYEKLAKGLDHPDAIDLLTVEVCNAAVAVAKRKGYSWGMGFLSNALNEAWRRKGDAQKAQAASDAASNPLVGQIGQKADGEYQAMQRAWMGLGTAGQSEQIKKMRAEASMPQLPPGECMKRWWKARSA
jgi:hypothetical protein